MKKSNAKTTVIKLTKKVTFEGLDNITFHPGTLLRVIGSAKNYITYATPITKNAISRVPLRYKAHLDRGFSFKTNEWKFAK